MNRSFQDSWRNELVAVAKDPLWETWADLKSGRTLLCRLRRALVGAPESLRLNKFASYSEQYISAEMERLCGDLDKPNNGRFWDVDAADEDLFWRSVLALRYLDLNLSNTHSPQFGAEPQQFRTFDGEFVFPIQRFRGDSQAHQRQGFERRGLLYHRIVPPHFSDIEMCVHIHPDVRLDPENGQPFRKVGASFFPKCGVEVETLDEKSFVVKALDGPDDVETTILSQCEQASIDGCDTLVWPELTISPDFLAVIRNCLAAKQLKGEYPSVVVAGSWHVSEGDGYVNRSTVLNGRGETLFSFDKCLPYDYEVDVGGRAIVRKESIQPGKAVHFLVTEDELIAFFICKDFCHNDRRALLRDCDASYALVPSMGEQSTIDSHLRSAVDLHIQVGTLSVVVQQNPSKHKEPRGFLLPGSQKPQKLDSGELSLNSHFTSFNSGA